MIWLEAIGLSLAVLDFGGLTHRVEAMLDGVRRRFARFWLVFGRALKLIVDAQSSTQPQVLQAPVARTLIIIAGLSMALATVAFIGVLVYYGAVVDREPPPSMLAGAMLLATPAILAMISIVLIFLVAIILLPVVEILELMDRAPSGMVGSIGLLLAAIGFLQGLL